MDFDVIYGSKGGRKAHSDTHSQPPIPPSGFHPGFHMYNNNTTTRDHPSSISSQSPSLFHQVVSVSSSLGGGVMGSMGRPKSQSSASLPSMALNQYHSQGGYDRSSNGDGKGGGVGGGSMGVGNGLDSSVSIGSLMRR